MPSPSSTKAGSTAIARSIRRGESVGALADRARCRHRGPGGGAARQVGRNWSSPRWEFSKPAAVYLPVDPTYPDDRLTFILDDAQAKLVLREPVTGLQRYSAAEPSELIRPLRPENTAYLIYTSGSTGLPKGVPVPHAPIAEYFVWFGDEYRVDETDRLLQVASSELRRIDRRDLWNTDLWCATGYSASRTVFATSAI